MAYRVEVLPRADEDAHAVHLYIAQDSLTYANRWFEGLLEAYDTLREMPTGFPLAPEAEELGIELRQLHYGKRPGVYRILFTVSEEERVVRILRVWHGARERPLVEDVGE